METGQSRSSPREPHVLKGLRLSAVEGSHSRFAMFPSEMMRRKTVNGWQWRALGGYTGGSPPPTVPLFKMHSTPGM